VLRKIFGSKREEATGDWKKVHNEKLHDLYSPNNVGVIKSRRMKLAGHVARMRERRGVYRVFVGKPERNISLGRSCRICEDNIKVSLKETGWEVMDRFGSG
jgi:hypothetical protein